MEYLDSAFLRWSSAAPWSNSGLSNIFSGFSTGMQNTAIGYSAGYNITTGTSSNPSFEKNYYTAESWYDEISWDVSSWIGDIRFEINKWLKAV